MLGWDRSFVTRVLLNFKWDWIVNYILKHKWLSDKKNKSLGESTTIAKNGIYKRR